MTWIIGIPTPFGYSTLLSDVQVTVEFSDGRVDHHDIVQKIYPMGNYAMAGFSGDIENGFLFLQSLKDYMNSKEEDKEWIPEQLAKKWGEVAKYTYRSLPKNKQTNLSILISAIDPFEDNGVAEHPRAFVAKLTAPDFKYESSVNGKPLSIGSGNNKNEYLKLINDLSKDPTKLMQMEAGNRFGYAGALGVVISYEVFRNPHPGVSKNIHMACITKMGYQTLPMNFTADIGEKNEKKVEMPELATNWTGFNKIISDIYEGKLNKAEAHLIA